MGKKITFGLLAIAFGLLYNLYSTDLEQPKKKVMLIEHNYDSEVLWIDNKFYDIIENGTYTIENAPKGTYKLVDNHFTVKENNINIIITKINR